jgi:hypothetical protein
METKMNKLTTFAALGALAASTLSVQAADCKPNSSSNENCVEVMQAAESEIVYTGSAASLSPELIALIISLGLGYLLIDSGSGSN